MRNHQISTLLLASTLLAAPMAAQNPFPIPKPGANGPTDYTESPVKPEIAGFVRLAKGGEKVPKIEVRLETSTGSMLAQTFSGNLGEFTFPNIPCGDYILAVDAPGFAPVRVSVEHSYIPAGTIFLNLMSSGASTTPAVNPESAALKAPKAAVSEYDKGIEALSSQKLDEGILHFQKAIQIFPDYDSAYNHLGWAYLQQRNYAESQKALSQAILRNHRNAIAYLLLGSVRKQQNQFPEAVPFFERSLRIEEQSWKAHLELAEVLLKLNKRDEAFSHFTRAHDLNPLQPSTHLELYNMLILRDDYAGAMTELDEFLKLFPQHPMASRARQQRTMVQTKLTATRQ
ncbi:MAG: tetratricopeptide repeat protein [Acidobacteria bacterium]|nr:tetratricopeptide repeat protein [Acidobacteriota bacterium]